ICVKHTDLLVSNIHTRMPFKYGIATLTAVPHLVVRVTLEVDGNISIGLSADNMPPKWFTKNPEQSFDEELMNMSRVIKSAVEFAKQAGVCKNVFDLWKKVYDRQMQWGLENEYPPLLWSFGVSLIERAVIDAFCKATGQTLAEALYENRLGIDFGALKQELTGMAPADVLPSVPLRQINLRHTVGLSDPLTDDEIPEHERVSDDLPQSLSACIQAYNLRYFKIKLCGKEEVDTERLKRIAGILNEQGIHDYRFTLDGNEQFTDLNSLKTFWQHLKETPLAEDFLTRLIVMEQPFHRDIALNDDIADGLKEWDDHPPMIIDESDGTLDSLQKALDIGYSGVSHKNCKGIFKGLYNAALISYNKGLKPDSFYILTAEDLTNIGPFALNQDLAMVSILGIGHVERNGHHYFYGLSFFNKNLQQAALHAHPDLYEEKSTITLLKIKDGLIQTGSVVDAPFGYDFEPDLSDFIPLEEWAYESLNE
ncbi:MAG: hypothetical protein WD267_01390, partial [Balneolales bacterium]